MSIRTIIVDDNQDSTFVLKKLLEEYCPEVEIISEFHNAKDAIIGINELNPNLVFCDIEMPGTNGFEMIDSINDINFDVIFVTSHNEYSLKAFRYSAIDYILKPPSPSELIEAVEKVSKKKTNITHEQLSQLLNNIQGGYDKKRLSLNTHERIIFVNIEDIIRCEASGVYTIFHLKDGKKHMVSKNIQKYEDLLGDQGFYRPHRSHIINLSYVKEFVKKGEGYMLMADGSKVDISRYKKEEILKKLGNN